MPLLSNFLTPRESGSDGEIGHPSKGLNSHPPKGLTPKGLPLRHRTGAKGLEGRGAVGVREGFFSESGLPVYGVLGISAGTEDGWPRLARFALWFRVLEQEGFSAFAARVAVGAPNINYRAGTPSYTIITRSSPASFFVPWRGLSETQAATPYPHSFLEP